MPDRTIADAFDRVVVVNLDRRPHRLATTSAQLGQLGVPFERFAAVDGRAPAVEREWRAYAEGELVRLPAGMRPVMSHREFYLDYDDDLARVAFVEARDGRKAIATAGAWGLLASMTAVVERALAEGWESLLVLEDDVLWHRDSAALFARAIGEAPADWQILQLGAMQLHWEAGWITWHSEHLYRCGGSSIGAHAFGVRRAVLPLLLERARARDLPFDIGALHSAKRAFAERCFTIFPNLAIQDATDSEIGMSTLFFREARKVDNIYRWHLPDYGLAALRAQAGTEPPADRALDARPTDEAGEDTPGPLPPVGRLTTLLARRLPWRRADPDPARGSPQPPGQGKPSGPPRRLGGQPPLQAHANRRPRPHAIVAIVVGLEGEALVRVLDSLQANRGRTNTEPIVVTDSDAAELFRRRDLVFEYLPPPDRRLRFAPELDWDLYLLRRLAVLRRKWQPRRIVTFGPAARRLVEAWRESPFEDESIRQVAGGTPIGPGHD